MLLPFFQEIRAWRLKETFELTFAIHIVENLLCEFNFHVPVVGVQGKKSKQIASFCMTKGCLHESSLILKDFWSVPQEGVLNCHMPKCLV